MINLRKLPVTPMVLLFIVLAADARSEMSSTSYRLTSSVISGGAGNMSATGYRLVSTLGQSTPPGSSSSAGYRLYSGMLYSILLAVAGDLNGDGTLDLRDVIGALQVVTRQSPVTVMKEADADGDGRIGLSEAIHILNRLSH